MLRKSHFVALILIAVFVVGGLTAFAVEKPNMKPMFATKRPDAHTQALINKIYSNGTGGPITVTNFGHPYILPADGRMHWYRMVGQDPAIAADNGTTTVPNTIWPLKILFDNDQNGPNPMILDGNNQLTNVINSPLYATADYISGSGIQYGDAIQRGSFWNDVSSVTPNWHTNLGGPAIGDTQFIEVPAAFGFWFNSDGQFPAFGLMDINFFSNALSGILVTTNPSPRELATYLSDDVFLYFGNPNACCVLGFHSAFSSNGGNPGPGQPLNTFYWGSWIAPGLFGGGFQDITALSHEESEWYADPFINNGLPRWNQPGGAPCFNNILEVGDAVEALPNPVFQVTTNGMTYNPEDEALVSFFTQDVPSNGINGWYSFTNELPGPATYCVSAPSAAKKK